ncbi:MAG: hypothetical protein FWG12_03710 [Holophagaceae bacterium]|nr:hypothetical protein [Holophagaceae bacterium]
MPSKYEGDFPPLLVLRRYLKLLLEHCKERGCLDTEPDSWGGIGLPFRADLLPFDYPAPDRLRL